MRSPVGVALSGGATLGAAHVGALRALEETDIPVERLAGTSIGAVVTALYAFRVPLEQIEQIALDMTWLSISSFRPSLMGLLANQGLGDLLREHIGEPDFADAAIPFGVVATDIGTGERVVFDAGPVIPAVVASACVPGVFQPVEHDGRMLVDGGLVDNLPSSVVTALGARTVVGIDLNTRRSYQPPDDLIDVMLNATDIAINNATRLQSLRGIDLHIAPELSAYSRFRSGRGPELIEEGHRAAHAAVDAWHGGYRLQLEPHQRSGAGARWREPMKRRTAPAVDTVEKVETDQRR